MRTCVIALLLAACTGGKFDGGVQQYADASGSVDGGQRGGNVSSPPLSSLDDATRGYVDSGKQDDSGISVRHDSDVGAPDANTRDTANGDSGNGLTCPGDVSHCDGKAWNGHPCGAGYGACCNGELCWCCLGG